jgi:hypothetical protein
MKYETLFENNQITLSKVTIMAQEEIGWHRDAYPEIVIAIRGGTITRIEANGTIKDVTFPTGTAVHRKADPIGELHRSINKGSEDLELIVLAMKE